MLVTPDIKPKWMKPHADDPPTITPTEWDTLSWLNTPEQNWTDVNPIERDSTMETFLKCCHVEYKNNIHFTEYIRFYWFMKSIILHIWYPKRALVSNMQYINNLILLLHSVCKIDIQTLPESHSICSKKRWLKVFITLFVQGKKV